MNETAYRHSRLWSRSQARAFRESAHVACVKAADGQGWSCVEAQDHQFGVAEPTRAVTEPAESPHGLGADLVE